MRDPVIIAQDPEEARLAYSLQCRANIDLVGLTGVSAQCKLNAQEATFPLKFGLHFQPEKATIAGQRLTTRVLFTLRIADSNDTDAVSFECGFRADYELTEAYQPTPEEIEAFAQSNAVFNCWPYFRELAQSALARMNYPPLSIPFLRLAPKPAEATRAVQAKLGEGASDKANRDLRRGKRRPRTKKE